MRRRLTLGAIIAAVAVACSSAPQRTAPERAIALPSFGPGSSYHPVINPSNFTAIVDNPWFPLKPGTTKIFIGTKEGEPTRDLFTTLTQTNVIRGVTCRIVRDLLYIKGVLEERTLDYYAQDRTGNVWYFGEDTAELDTHGKVTTTEGTWHAGVAGAEPGVFMEAHPHLGRMFRQEYYKGHAEDQYKVVSLDASVNVPYGSFQRVMRTEETTALEPDVLDNKLYVRGIGEVAAIAVKGPEEKALLSKITSGAAS